jgi:hypothetical protein
VAAIAWVFAGLLEVLVWLALFPKQRTEGAVSILWGLGFGLFLWFGVWTLGVRGANAILFALVAGAVIALFVYTRGAALDQPAVEQPGVFQRELLTRWRARRSEPRVSYHPRMGKTRELVQAQADVVHGEFESALFYVREAERVAVAQRKLGELVEVRDLVTTMSARSVGQTKEDSEALAWKVDEELYAFPAAELATVGIHKESDRELLDRLRAQQERAPAAGESKTRELRAGRLALDDGSFDEALFLLREAERVAVAQRRLGELLEVHDLVQILAERSDGRTREGTEALAYKLEADLHSFA